MLSKSCEMVICWNRIRPREEPLKLFTSWFISQLGKFLQEKEQITKRIKPIALGRLNHAKTQCTCISTLGCITKKKILPRHNKELHGALCNVVCKFTSLPSSKTASNRFRQFKEYVCAFCRFESFSEAKLERKSQ